jgi:hypothetical protein
MIGSLHGPKGITDGEVRVATRKGLQEWLALLDTWNSDDKRFQPTLRYLMMFYGLNYYWAQVIAVFYVMNRSYADPNPLAHVP